MRLFLFLASFLAPAIAGAQQAASDTPPPQTKSSLRWQNYAQTPAQPLAAQPSAPAPAPAQPEVETTSDYLTRMDGDGDDRVSPAEYLDWMDYAFDARDLDRDGVLSVAELPGGKGQPILRAQHRQRIAERFRKQDADGSGFLDTKELAAPPR